MTRCLILSTSTAVPHHRSKPSDVASLNSCKRVGPRDDQADNNSGLRGRLNVWPRLADSMMARENPPQSRIHECNRSRLPGLKQKRQRGKTRIKRREAVASQYSAVRG